MDQIKVRIEYNWTFNKKEWAEQKDHIKGVEADIKTKLDYDPMSMFYFLNDITYPQVSAADITHLEKSN